MTAGRRAYAKQEQEPASEEVVEAAPGVLRLQLPIDMPGLGHVNCYAVEDGDGAVLIDPGLPGEVSWSALNRRLDKAGIPLRRVHTAVITHSHPDHFGGSHQLREETGAELVTHESFTAAAGGFRNADEVDLDLLELGPDELVELWKQRVAEMAPTPWGTRRQPPPDEAIRRWIEMGGEGAPPRLRFPEPTVRVADGQALALGSREWFCVHTPGHTEDHLCLWDPEGGVLVSGDHVLPTITPHIAGSAGPGDPLARFFASLDRVGAFDPVTVCLPAHGHPITDLAARTAAIRRHHVERLDVLRAAAGELVDAPVEAYMKALFRERAWGQMAASETFAHLEHLRLTGEAASRRDGEGLLRYRLDGKASSIGACDGGAIDSGN